MKITIEPDMECEEGKVTKTVFLNVVEYALAGMRTENDFPTPIRQAHLWDRRQPFDLIEKLAGLNAHLICHACTDDKS